MTAAGSMSAVRRGSAAAAGGLDGGEEALDGARADQGQGAVAVVCPGVVAFQGQDQGHAHHGAGGDVGGLEREAVPVIVSSWRAGVSGSSRSTAAVAATRSSTAFFSGSTTASMNSWSLLSKWR